MTLDIMVSLFQMIHEATEWVIHAIKYSSYDVTVIQILWN